MTRKHYWVWPIATYLFLGGMGGGTFFLIWILRFFKATHEATVCMAMPIFWGLFCLAFGCFLLVFELGQPRVFLRVFFNSWTSVIGHGARILSVALIFGFIAWTYYIPFLPWYSAETQVLFRDLCIAIAGIFGFATMVYTGVLLASMKSKPFWNTPLLPVLFVTSATSTGSACIALSIGSWPFSQVAGMETQGGVMSEIVHLLHGLDQGLIIAEICILLLWVFLMYFASNTTARESARKWITGSWAGLFWGGMIAAGLLFPLFLYQMGFESTGVIAAVFVIASGLLLRFMIVFTDERRTVPGETRFYSRIAGNDAEFMHPEWGLSESMGGRPNAHDGLLPLTSDEKFKRVMEGQ